MTREVDGLGSILTVGLTKTDYAASSQWQRVAAAQAHDASGAACHIGAVRADVYQYELSSPIFDPGVFPGSALIALEYDEPVALSASHDQDRTLMIDLDLMVSIA